MNPLTFVYYEILFRPLFNLLVGVTYFLPNHNIGIATLVVTFIVRLILFPFSLHQARQAQANQVKMAALQAELKKIHEQHKDDKNKKAAATMALYRKAGVNPAAGCLPLVIQLPFLIALYRVFLHGVGPDTWQSLYSFVPTPQHIQLVLFGFDLTHPSLILAIIAGVAQVLQMRQMPTNQAMAGTDDTAQAMASMQKNMAYLFPLMTVFIVAKLPAALGVYLIGSTLFALAQQQYMRRFMHLSAQTPVM